jgi:hypothetical protein
MAAMDISRSALWPVVEAGDYGNVRGKASGVGIHPFARRSAARLVMRGRAGAVTKAAPVTIPALRSGIKNAAPRPGRGMSLRNLEDHSIILS